MTTFDRARAVTAAPLNATEKLILRCLNDYTGKDGYCWPGVPRIAADASTSERSVNRLLKRLRTVGLLQSERRDNANGRRQSDKLTVDWERLPQLEAIEEKTAAEQLPLFAHLADGLDVHQSRKPAPVIPSTCRSACPPNGAATIPTNPPAPLYRQKEQPKKEQPTTPQTVGVENDHRSIQDRLISTTLTALHGTPPKIVQPSESDRRTAAAVLDAFGPDAAFAAVPDVAKAVRLKFPTCMRFAGTAAYWEKPAAKHNAPKPTPPTAEQTAAALSRRRAADSQALEIAQRRKIAAARFADAPAATQRYYLDLVRQKSPFVAQTAFGQQLAAEAFLEAVA